MYTAYYSSVLDHPADKVWTLVRDFNNYPRYIEGVSESTIEDERRGDEVGAVRRFCYAGAWIRQRLVAHSDIDRTFTYAGLDRFHFPAESANSPAPIDYEGTLRLTPIIHRDRTFIEWSVAFDASPQDAPRWTEFLSSAIPQWVNSLRRTLDRQGRDLTGEETRAVMQEAFFSIRFPFNPDRVWQAIRSFRHYEWGEGVGPAIIEGGRPDNEVGSVRAFTYYGAPSRQRLTAHSDADRSYSWESCEPYESLERYELTLKVEPADDQAAEVVWLARYSAPDAETPKWDTFFAQEFEKSLMKLRRQLEAAKA